ncbi:GNAT family N-acetyltransferase [Vallicoccus soli]|uniref:GNAT family N-acetyltransferase n=1 Tax=Vallicoccus soli TaxID=2339232 RepID=A0A3A3Z038_9ACTN|nr:GNAT family N-acetyltransferase [Vallicoccus soli]RJK97610.1 GNAT family N-acetyltransferase [Vallicoccus soli]
MTVLERAPAPVGGYAVRPAGPSDLAAVRALVLDVTLRDLGYGYEPAWHRDLDRAAQTYLAPGRTLLVAVDGDGRVVATAGVRPGGPTAPAAMVERYARAGRVAQLVRVATDPAHRRRGLARALAEGCRAFAATAGYDVLCLHTNARTPAALPFWRSLGAVVVLDERGREADPRLATVHLELPLGRAAAG